MTDSRLEQLDFIVIGAQKAGTTSLFEYLRHHPGLALPSYKEAPYFSHDRAYFADDWQGYLAATFHGADPAARWGTVTPHYMVGGVYEPSDRGHTYDERTVPDRIREQIPNVRLIAMLRDPIERTLSHYRMAVLRNIEDGPFDRAIERLLGPAAMSNARRHPHEATGYVAWSEYGRILGAYFELFPPEQLLILYTHDLEQRSGHVLRRIYEFLDVDAGFVPENLGRRYRAGATTRRVSWLDLSAARRRFAAAPAAQTAWSMLPRDARRRVDALSHGLIYHSDQWNRRSAGAAIHPSPQTIVRLHGHFAPDAQRLAHLTGADPPWAAAYRGGDVT
jgi:hypothetical protein